MMKMTMTIDKSRSSSTRLHVDTQYNDLLGPKCVSPKKRELKLLDAIEVYYTISINLDDWAEGIPFYLVNMLEASDTKLSTSCSHERQHNRSG